MGEKIVSDSSFYLCFIDDIKFPSHIIKIISSDLLNFQIGSIVKEEIKKSQNYEYIGYHVENGIEYIEYFHYGELLRPLFSLDEIEEGEHEVIAIGYILYSKEQNFKMIMDDGSPRKFVATNFPDLGSRLCYTTEFIKLCCLEYHIFDKNEAITILELVKESPFFVKDIIVDEIIEQIRCS